MSDVKFCFENKNFVVVGASSGMGRQIALDLAESGAHVLAIARNAERLHEVQAMFPDHIIVHQLDVLEAKSEDWEEVLADFVKSHGKIHGGVYSAGITGMTSLRMFDEDFAYRIIETSFWGMIRFLQQANKKKYLTKSSSFVVFSSIGAYVGNKGQFAYSAAKSAVQASVRSIAKEICRDGHRINSISPGWVETNMTQSEDRQIISDDIFKSYLLGTGQPKDVSDVVLFLLSDAARWITGTDVVVDGGSLLGTD